MENNYYQTMLNELKNYLALGQYQPAIQLIEVELAQPYVPLDILKQLEELKRFCLAELKVAVPEKHLSSLELKQLLAGTEVEQLEAALKLRQYALAPYFKLISEYLAQAPLRSVAAILIEACIKQGIHLELVYNIAGKRYEFIPLYVMLPLETDGYLLASELLAKWLINISPSFLKLAQDRLIEQVYLALPESYEQAEAEILATSICFKLADEMGDLALKQQLITVYKLAPERVIDLLD